MKRFVDGVDRSQGLLLPDRLEDYVHEDNPVRVVDAFVEALDLGGLGFEAVNRAASGRPAYHPGALLKIYIYGYLNRIQSSRRLEREVQRNLELIWLTGRLAPDFKTIADFRKDNGGAITAVCSRFIALCRKMKVFSHAVVAIDGSKLKAVNSRDRNFTVGKVKGRRKQLEESVARYLAELDRADRDATLLPEGRVPHLKDKLAKLRVQMDKLDTIERQLLDAPDHQISLTDPDARSMTSSGRGTGTVGYNVQAAVDAEHHLIVAHDVTNAGHDRTQLSAMAKKAREALGTERMTALADRGYFNAPEILACAGRHYPAGAQAAHLEQQSRRPVRQAGLHLRPGNGCVRMPGRRACDPSLHDRRERTDVAQVLVVRLSPLPDADKVHHLQLSADHALGA